MNKVIVILLVLLLIVLQYKLWFASGGFRDTRYLKNQIAEQKALSAQLQERNTKIANNIRTLKNSADAIESRARKDLGMVKKGETFYQISE